MTKIVVSYTLNNDLAADIRKLAARKQISASMLAGELLKASITEKSINKQETKDKINKLLNQL